MLVLDMLLGEMMLQKLVRIDDKCVRGRMTRPGGHVRMHVVILLEGGDRRRSAVWDVEYVEDDFVVYASRNVACA